MKKHVNTCFEIFSNPTQINNWLSFNYVFKTFVAHIENDHFRIKNVQNFSTAIFVEYTFMKCTVVFSRESSVRQQTNSCNVCFIVVHLHSKCLDVIFYIKKFVIIKLVK